LVGLTGAFVLLLALFLFLELLRDLHELVVQALHEKEEVLALSVIEAVHLGVGSDFGERDAARPVQALGTRVRQTPEPDPGPLEVVEDLYRLRSGRKGRQPLLGPDLVLEVQIRVGRVGERAVERA
jgi:hypothetical protein